MTGIQGRGRRGSTVVPNWRWEDPDLDSYGLHVAGWIASHVDAYCAEHVTRNEIARKTRVSAGKVTKVLECLSTLGIIEIDHRPTPGGGRDRLVIIFDFDAWEGRARSPHDLAKVTTRPSQGHQVTTTRGQQVETHLENPPNPPAITPLEVVDGRFAAFWEAYPRKVDKKDARKVFDRLMKTVDHEDILIGLDPWLDYWEERGDPSFIPHPTTWLNKERWLASPPELKPNVSKGTAALMEIVKNRSAQ